MFEATWLFWKDSRGDFYYNHSNNVEEQAGEPFLLVPELSGVSGVFLESSELARSQIGKKNELWTCHNHTPEYYPASAQFARSQIWHRMNWIMWTYHKSHSRVFSGVVRSFQGFFQKLQSWLGIRFAEEWIEQATWLFWNDSSTVIPWSLKQPN